MTTERTPQDVLRAENERLRMVLIEARDWHGLLGHNDIVARITNVLEGREANGAPLDKAIAEAPGSPESSETVFASGATPESYGLSPGGSDE